MARDPDGIGLADLSQMPKDDKSVTLLAIDVEKGSGASDQGAEKATPVAGDVPEDYPLVQPCVLYVSPAAGDAAKGFFAWLGSAGANAEGGNHDRAELLARFGLLPGRNGLSAGNERQVEQPGEAVATLGKEPQVELEEARAAGNDSVGSNSASAEGDVVNLPQRGNATAKNAKDAKKRITAGANAPAGNRTAPQSGEAAGSSDAMTILLGFVAVGGIVSVVAVSRVKRRKPSVAPHAASRQSRATRFDGDYDALDDLAGSTGDDGTLANDRGPSIVREEKTFDPYHVWLSIPREEQPANHYRLLGLAAFESDREVIEEAADRQMAHLRTYQLGQFAALSQELLNEVSAAKGCLLSPTKKPIYDAHLRRRLSASKRLARRWGAAVSGAFDRPSTRQTRFKQAV